MYQVLARKYRPQTFSDLLGQEHVKATIESAITKNRIAHGYIFAGQRGTGKTTVARILARCLNCAEGPTPTPCGVCPSCKEISAGGSPDVIEIDAASNRGINEMRELRESVRYRPSRDRFKVFIIDEAHQITNEAFNALLKTLEEPPEWVVFILCTTESHKIPITIASRCQQFSFRSVDFQALVDRMAWICEQEGIAADPEALAVLAQAGGGSVRDSLSALDQAIAAAGNRLEASEVRQLLGMFSVDSLDRVTQALIAQDPQALIEIVFELERSGQSMQHFVRELARYFRNLVVIKIGGPDVRLVPASPRELQHLTQVSAQFGDMDLTRYLQIALDLFKELQYSLQPRLHLELGLLRMLYASRLQPIEEALGGLPATAAAPVKAATPAPRPTPPAPVRSAAPASAAPKTTSTPTPAAEPTGETRDLLAKTAEDLGMNFTADAIRNANIDLVGEELQIKAPAEYLLSFSDKDMGKITQAAYGKRFKIKVSAGAVANPAAAPSKQANKDAAFQRAAEDPIVKKAQELFGGGELRTVRDLSEN